MRTTERNLNSQVSYAYQFIQNSQNELRNIKPKNEVSHIIWKCVEIGENKGIAISVKSTRKSITK